MNDLQLRLPSVAGSVAIMTWQNKGIRDCMGGDWRPGQYAVNPSPVVRVL